MGSMMVRGANVVSLARTKADMRFPVISEVQAYWDGLRGGRPVPLRAEVDPRGIERALENAFVLERIAPGMARFRLAGMHLNDLMGMEVRGMPLSAFFTPKAREDMARILEAVFSGPEIAEITLTAERGIGKPAIEGKLLILPLKSDLGEVTRALGCLASVGPVGRSPRRFDIVSVKVTRIGSPDKADPRREPAPAQPAPMPTAPAYQAPARPVPVAGFGEAAPAYTAPLSGEIMADDDQPQRARPAVMRPSLRLVRSDE